MPTREELGLPPTCYGLGEISSKFKANTDVAGSVLIDPGPDLEALLAGLHEHKTPLESLKLILLTHFHLDHYAALLGLYNAILKAGGEPKVLIPQGGTVILADNNPLMLGKQYYPNRPTPKMPPFKELREGVEVEVGGVLVKGILVPGHTQVQMAYLITVNGITWASAGDASGLLDPRVGFNLNEYRESQFKLVEAARAHNAVGIHIGHGHQDYLESIDAAEDKANNNTVLTEGDLVPGPFEETLYPHS